jgi:putative redox protein
MTEVNVEVWQIGDTATSEGLVRGHRVLIDRPRDKGGSDRGPLGGEYLLIALGGCYLSNLIAAARARDLELTDLQVVVHGEVTGQPERFQSVIMEVQGRCSDESTLRKLIEIAERSCIVTNTLKESMPVRVQRASLRA